MPCKILYINKQRAFIGVFHHSLWGQCWDFLLLGVPTVSACSPLLSGWAGPTYSLLPLPTTHTCSSFRGQSAPCQVFVNLHACSGSSAQPDDDEPGCTHPSLSSCLSSLSSLFSAIATDSNHNCIQHIKSLTHLFPCLHCWSSHQPSLSKVSTRVWCCLVAEKKTYYANCTKLI